MNSYGDRAIPGQERLPALNCHHSGRILRGRHPFSLSDIPTIHLHENSLLVLGRGPKCKTLRHSHKIARNGGPGPRVDSIPLERGGKEIALSSRSCLAWPCLKARAHQIRTILVLRRKVGSNGFARRVAFAILAGLELFDDAGNHFVANLPTMPIVCVVKISCLRHPY